MLLTDPFWASGLGAASWSAQAAFELGIHVLLDGLVATLERNGARVAR
ncbi:hypothetical protein [Paeniglutamicibacter sp. NPDC091659]